MGSNKKQGHDKVPRIRDHELGTRITGHGTGIRDLAIGIDSKSQYFNLRSS